MRQRRGEKVGWIAGWLGGFLWLCILSVLWLALGRITDGVLGLVLFAAAVAAIFTLAPWKHPEARYWKLMLPIYVILAAALGLCVWRGGGFGKLELSPWSLFLLMPLLIPFATAGARCWKDGDA
ncbi:MAG: hypothetical protein ACYSU0_04975 [Planctomycetota bacterium]|jgi:amino acid transporter